MDKIPSFCKNHDYLQPGFHACGTANGVSTWDLRFKKPNAGDFISPKALHTVEHLLATVYRNSERKGDIVYFGPMGCRTGFYLLTVNMDGGEALALTKLCLERALELNEIPGSAREECGNYLEHDLRDAKRELAAYKKLLEELEND